MKRIVLCADDYGQAEAISQGILSLIEKGRLSATSCMVNTQFWPSHAKRLMPFVNQVDLGLHFNLTEGKAMSEQYIALHGTELMPLRTLLGKAFLGKLNQAAIEAELHTQIDRFVSAVGFLPRFIDGHQHVHQFPIIRNALIKVYEQRLCQENVCVRLVNTKIKLKDFANGFKKIIIQATGVKALRNLLKQHKICYNQSFAGIYTFSQASHYNQLFYRFLSEIGDGGLIMCHPGLLSSSTEDNIAKARYEEYLYISSSQFLEDCKRHRIQLETFSFLVRFGQNGAL